MNVTKLFTIKYFYDVLRVRNNVSQDFVTPILDSFTLLIPLESFSDLENFNL